jgi:hypothetical protein
VTLTLTFTSDEDREIVTMTTGVTKKLGGMRGSAGKILIGFEGGRVVYSEKKSRQTLMAFDEEKAGEEEVGINVDEDGVVTPIKRSKGGEK